MGGGAEWALHLNATASLCVDCGDMRPPPDDILAIPPPPLPAFLQLAPPGSNGSGGGTPAPCSVQCDWSAAPGLEYVELTRRGPVIDDTWLLVLIASCLGVLLLGALLALLLLRFRVERGGKSALAVDTGSLGRGKSGRTCEAVLYPAPAAPHLPAPDSRALWATLTPRGTTHHYTAEQPPPLPPPSTASSFENCGYVDSDDAALQGCYALGQLAEPAPPPLPPPRRSPPLTTGRPRVSRPTRIEHPNLPPLNLQPRARVTRRPRRDSEVSSASTASAVVL